MIVAHVIKGIASHIDTRLQEWIFSIMLLMLGMQLLRTGTTFETSKGYAVMREIAGEEVWGVALFLIASLRLGALIVNGTFVRARRFSPYIRSIGAGLTGVVWMILSLSIMSANPIALVPIVFGGLTVSDMLMCVRIAREAGEAERKYQHACSARIV